MKSLKLQLDNKKLTPIQVFN